eukprot:gb/GECG01006695.1/.p1 GENE.gb/GECG01006695.1/~~gb/GECG01006695.1/.p1  ORF type:complete len:839 (+),score=97.52 gb/GECG01006695.1/:1-2517(+)
MAKRHRVRNRDMKKIISLDDSHYLRAKHTDAKLSRQEDGLEKFQMAVSKVKIEHTKLKDVKRHGSGNVGVDKLVERTRPKAEYLQIKMGFKVVQTLRVKWTLADYYLDESRRIRSVWMLQPLSYIETKSLREWLRGELTITFLSREGHFARRDEEEAEGIEEDANIRFDTIRVPQGILSCSKKLHEFYEMWSKGGPVVSSPIDAVFHSRDQVDGLGWVTVQDFRHVMDREIPDFLQKSSYSLPVELEDLDTLEKWLRCPMVCLKRTTGRTRETLIDYWLFCMMLMQPASQYRTLAIIAGIRRCFLSNFGSSKGALARRACDFFQIFSRDTSGRIRVDQLHKGFKRELKIDVTVGTLRDILSVLRVYVDVHDEVDYTVLLMRLFGKHCLKESLSIGNHHRLRRVKKHLRRAARSSHLERLQIKALWKQLVGNRESYGINHLIKRIQEEIPLLASMDSSEALALKKELDANGDRNTSFKDFDRLLQLDSFDQERIKHQFRSHFSTVFAHDAQDARELVETFCSRNSTGEARETLSVREFIMLSREVGIPVSATDISLCAELFQEESSEQSTEEIRVKSLEFMLWGLSHFGVEDMMELSEKVEDNIELHETHPKAEHKAELQSKSPASESAATMQEAHLETSTSDERVSSPVSTSAAETAGRTALAASVHPDAISPDSVEELERIGSSRRQTEQPQLESLVPFFHKGRSQKQADEAVHKRSQEVYSSHGTWICNVCAYRNTNWCVSCYMCANPRNSGETSLSPEEEAYWIAETGNWWVDQVDKTLSSGDKENQTVLVRRGSDPQKEHEHTTQARAPSSRPSNVQSFNWRGDPLQRPPGMLQ